MPRKPRRRTWGTGSIFERDGQITPDMVDGGVEALNRAARDPGAAAYGYPQPPAPRLLQSMPADDEGARP